MRVVAGNSFARVLNPHEGARERERERERGYIPF